MSASKIVFVVQQYNADFDVVRVQLDQLRNISFYDFDADIEREDPIEFAIDNPDRSLDMVIDEDPDMGLIYQGVEVFSTRELANEWQQLMYMQPNHEERKDAPYIWRQRVGFCG